MLASGWWQNITRYSAALQAFLGYKQNPITHEVLPDFTFSREWQVLGPFQIGTREVTWGADPLEYFGGFHALEYNPNATFKSSLPPNGTVSWSSYDAELSYRNYRQANADLSVEFMNVDWSWLKEVYGWSAFQWQGWARGEIYVRNENANPLILHTESVLEYWIDDVHYFGGDFYGYKKVPVTLRLEPGVHRIDVRLIRDVRSMGGLGRPSVDIKLELQKSRNALRALGGFDEQIMISDVIGGDWGPLVSPFASIILRNDGDRDIYVHGIEGIANKCLLELLTNASIRLVPGQTRPVGFRIGCIPSWNRRINLSLKYTVKGEGGVRFFQTTTWPRVLKGMEEPHRVTFVHPGGMVSYAILRPPSSNIKCGRKGNLTLPVMVALHGAGLEADSDLVKHALDNLPDLCAWLLFPTGVVPWSGDDWHNWGMADIEAAVAAIPRWIETVEWDGPGVDINKWLVSGHSNGGQGTWYVLTHRPDKVIAAAALSGYSSIQNYVPYTFWHTSDPGREAVVQGALLSYRHELLMENAKDIPVIQQHGSEDDNVPVYNARLMSQRIDQAGAESTYFEIPGRRHYWDGVMVTEPLEEFYETQLNRNIGPSTTTELQLRNFSMVVGDPGDMGSKNGVEVLRLLTPGKLGHLRLTFDPLTGGCVFQVRNIVSWRLGNIFTNCDYVVVNGQQIDIRANSEQGVLLHNDHSGWQVADFSQESSTELRTGRQQGAMDAILRTKGAFQIVQHSNGTDHIALQISRNLCQYFTADTEITEDYDKALAATGNVISISLDNGLPQDPDSKFPLTVGRGAVSIREHLNDGWSIVWDSFYGQKPFSVFLRPLPDERLELVVWAVDVATLGIAARLVPMLTGSGQPDFVVGDKNMLRKGVEGTLALGFFNWEWQISRNSFLDW